MEKRGRKSVAELSVIRAETAFRPRPPSDLSPEQATEWKEVIARLPAGWISRENEAILTQYCRHIVAARRIAQLITHAEGGKEFTIAGYDRLLKMQERESRACASLAVKLRLAPSTRLRAETAARMIAHNPNGPKPWDVDEPSA
jgi:phage terminase small subunit